MTERGVLRAGYKKFTPPHGWTDADFCYGKWLRDSAGDKTIHIVLKRFLATHTAEKWPRKEDAWYASVQLRKHRGACLDLELHHPFKLRDAERMFLKVYENLGFDPE